MLAKYGKNGCCNDEHDIIKIEDDHAASTVVSLVPGFYEIGQIFSEYVSIENDADVFSDVDESPPPLDHVPLFTMHCSLVFYDSMMS